MKWTVAAVVVILLVSVLPLVQSRAVEVQIQVPREQSPAESSAGAIAQILMVVGSIILFVLNALWTTFCAIPMGIFGGICGSLVGLLTTCVNSIWATCVGLVNAAYTSCCGVLQSPVITMLITSAITAISKISSTVAINNIVSRAGVWDISFFVMIGLEIVYECLACSYFIPCWSCFGACTQPCLGPLTIQPMVAGIPLICASFQGSFNWLTLGASMPFICVDAIAVTILGAIVWILHVMYAGLVWIPFVNIIMAAADIVISLIVFFIVDIYAIVCSAYMLVANIVAVIISDIVGAIYSACSGFCGY